jgi:hypothetical protein
MLREELIDPLHPAGSVFEYLGPKVAHSVRRGRPDPVEPVFSEPSQLAA